MRLWVDKCVPRGDQRRPEDGECDTLTIYYSTWAVNNGAKDEEELLGDTWSWSHIRLMA